MEVHHHAHTARKKWTHYFWEFLMLFLAVFCGFLAEYQLEHKIEKDRAKDFAVLMFEDLKKDTAFFKNCTDKFMMIKTHQDSLLLLLQSEFSTIDRYKITWHWINSIWALNFVSHHATYEQMKNSGSLRYIHNIRLVNSMQDYYNSLLPAISHYHNIQSELTEARIVPFIEDHISYQEADFLNSKMNVSNPEIFDWNKRTAIKLYNMISMLMNQNLFLHDLYINAGKKAQETMTILKEEYHLE